MLIEIYTPEIQKSNIDNKNCQFFNGITFSKPIGIYMLAFGGVSDMLSW